MKLDQVFFADTSFFTAIFNGRDQYHSRAMAWQRSITRWHRVVTTEAVLWEFLNGCAAPRTKAVVLGTYRRIHSDPSAEVVGYDISLIDRALDAYARHQDKAWGVTDCLSFEVMRSRRLKQALTADHHFRQAGFEALLLEEAPQGGV
jgi:uncharacterized protein